MNCYVLRLFCLLSLFLLVLMGCAKATTPVSAERYREIIDEVNRVGRISDEQAEDLKGL